MTTRRSRRPVRRTVSVRRAPGAPTFATMRFATMRCAATGWRRAKLSPVLTSVALRSIRTRLRPIDRTFPVARNPAGILATQNEIDAMRIGSGCAVAAIRLSRRACQRKHAPHVHPGKKFSRRFADATPRQHLSTPPRCRLHPEFPCRRQENSGRMRNQKSPGRPFASFAAGMATLRPPSAPAGSRVRSCTVSRNRFASRGATMPSVSAWNLAM